MKKKFQHKLEAEEKAYKLDIKNTDTVKITDYFSKVDWNKEFLGLNTDLMYEKFVDHYLKAVDDEFTPTQVYFI